MRPEAPYELVKQMRASVLVLGPLVARFGQAKVSLPGGCQIGARPIDQHLKGLEAMGCTHPPRARVRASPRDRAAAGACAAAEVCFDIPTVTGTENLMMAAALAKGRTTLVNCAREPEVEELGRVLNKMGAEVDGAGTDVIHIKGAERGELAPFDHAIIPDRIEAGTYMVAAAAVARAATSRSSGPSSRTSRPLVAKMRAAGVEIASEGQNVRVRRTGPAPPGERDDGAAPRASRPTCRRSSWCSCASRGARASSARPSSRTASCTSPSCSAWGRASRSAATRRSSRGSSKLYGASVMATDLRASASLVIAGLVAEDETEVRRVYHIDRGYEHIEEKLRGLGADIERVQGAEA